MRPGRRQVHGQRCGRHRRISFRDRRRRRRDRRLAMPEMEPWPTSNTETRKRIEVIEEEEGR